MKLVLPIVGFLFLAVADITVNDGDGLRDLAAIVSNIGGGERKPHDARL